MTDEMYTHENESLEFREGYRAGLVKALILSKELISDLKADKKINEACWVEVVRDWIDCEISMYEVGDEE